MLHIHDNKLISYRVIDSIIPFLQGLPHILNQIVTNLTELFNTLTVLFALHELTFNVYTYIQFRKCLQNNYALFFIAYKRKKKHL